MSRLRRILWGVNANRISAVDQAHIDWADSLLTPQQKMKKSISAWFGVPRHMLSDGPHNSTSTLLSLYRDTVDRMYYSLSENFDQAERWHDFLKNIKPTVPQHESAYPPKS